MYETNNARLTSPHWNPLMKCQHFPDIDLNFNTFGLKISQIYINQMFEGDALLNVF